MLSFKSVHHERFFVLECMAKIGLGQQKRRLKRPFFMLLNQLICKINYRCLQY